jgi:hypothetical protein
LPLQCSGLSRPTYAMGTRTTLIVSLTCFLIGTHSDSMHTRPSSNREYFAGTLATNFFVDSLTLWKSPTSTHNLYIASQYYSLLSKAPIEMAYAYLAIALLGGALITWSLFSLRAGNLMFDGGSLCTTLSLRCYSSRTHTINSPLCQRTQRISVPGRSECVCSPLPLCAR